MLVISFLLLKTKYRQSLGLIYVAGNKKAFLSKYGAINKSAVINFILRDKTNPSSVLSSIENARQNARIVRNNLTKELFETINETYLKLSEIFRRPVNEKNLLNTLATIRTKCQLTRVLFMVQCLEMIHISLQNGFFYRKS